MFDVNDILARLQGGDDPEDLANAYAKALNDAIELNRKQKEADLAAKAEAEKEALLNKYAQDMADAMLSYIKIADPEAANLLEDEDLTDVTEIRTLLDSAIKTIKVTLALATTLSDIPTPKTTKTPSQSNLSSDDSIKQFLKNFGL